MFCIFIRRFLTNILCVQWQQSLCVRISLCLYFYEINVSKWKKLKMEKYHHWNIILQIDIIVLTLDKTNTHLSKLGVACLVTFSYLVYWRVEREVYVSRILYWPLFNPETKCFALSALWEMGSVWFCVLGKNLGWWCGVVRVSRITLVWELSNGLDPNKILLYLESLWLCGRLSPLVS